MGLDSVSYAESLTCVVESDLLGRSMAGRHFVAGHLIAPDVERSTIGKNMRDVGGDVGVAVTVDVAVGVTVGRGGGRGRDGRRSGQWPQQRERGIADDDLVGGAGQFFGNTARPPVWLSQAPNRERPLWNASIWTQYFVPAAAWKGAGRTSW